MRLKFANELPALRRVRIRGGCVDLSRFPNFLIAGPQRTGTTWLFRNLQQHPSLFLPGKKELYYFSTLGKPEHPRFRFWYLEDYLGVFHETARERVKKTYDCLRRSGAWYWPRMRGEATASYATLSEEVIADIVALNPEIKVILMLRDPVERAWSHAKKEMRNKDGKPARVSEAGLREFFRSEGQRRIADYGGIVRRWSAHLRAGNVFLGDYQLIAARPRVLLEQISAFLGVPAPRVFRSRHLTERINATEEASMPEEVRIFLEDLLAVEREAYRSLLSQTISYGPSGTVAPAS